MKTTGSGKQSLSLPQHLSIVAILKTYYDDEVSVQESFLKPAFSTDTYFS